MINDFGKQSARCMHKMKSAFLHRGSTMSGSMPHQASSPSMRWLISRSSIFLSRSPTTLSSHVEEHVGWLFNFLMNLYIKLSVNQLSECIINWSNHRQSLQFQTPMGQAYINCVANPHTWSSSRHDACLSSMR